MKGGRGRQEVFILKGGVCGCHVYTRKKWVVDTEYL